MSITNVDNQVFKVHIYVYISHFNKKKERKKKYENPVYWLGNVHARDNGNERKFYRKRNVKTEKNDLDKCRGRVPGKPSMIPPVCVGRFLIHSLAWFQE